MTGLPIFNVTAATQRVEPDVIAKHILGVRDVTATTRGPQTSIRGSDAVVDVDAGRGGTWAGDLARMWRGARMELPADDSLTQIASEAQNRAGLTPMLSGPFHLAEPTVRHAKAVTEDAAKRTIASGEAVVGQDVVVDVSDRAGLATSTLPVFGGGGRFRTTIGEAGQVLGLHGVWRSPGLADERPLRSVDEAIEAAGMRSSADVRIGRSTLGYYSAPSFSGQDLLFPVYAVHSEVRDGDGWIPSRVRLIPATDVGEVGPREAPLLARAAPIVTHRFPGDLVMQPGAVLQPGLTVSTRHLRNAGLDPAAVLSRGPSGTIFVNANIAAEHLRVLQEAARPRSFGTSWIGSLGGLGGSQANVQGYVDQMRAEGWQMKFNWGNAAAWKSDWTSNDDLYVDDVDLVFYTGHAGPDGWMLASNGQGDWIHHNDVGAQPASPSDLWGQNNLEWMVVAACGPLEDDIINGGGNVFDRWRGAFDGLHLLMGYAAVTFDNTEEGSRFASYARSGMTLIQAWFRTAQEIQPGTNSYSDPYGPEVWAAAMFVGNATASTQNDHLWGHGSVAPDIRNSTFRGCTFAPC